MLKKALCISTAITKEYLDSLDPVRQKRQILYTHCFAGLRKVDGTEEARHIGVFHPVEAKSCGCGRPFVLDVTIHTVT